MGTQTLTSPGAFWAKALVVTDAMGDGNGFVEVAHVLLGLVGGGGRMGCSSPDKGLES